MKTGISKEGLGTGSKQRPAISLPNADSPGCKALGLSALFLLIAFVICPVSVSAQPLLEAQSPVLSTRAFSAQEVLQMAEQARSDRLKAATLQTFFVPYYSTPTRATSQF